MASPQNLYPEGNELSRFVRNRHRGGIFWRGLFIASVGVAIVALLVLIVSIINDSFGYTAVVAKVDPERLALDIEEPKLLAAENTFSSEDDNVLAEGIRENENAIGFFGYAYYSQNSDALQLVAVDGSLPTAEAEDYLLARPLYIYTSANVLQENQAANIFVNYYLTHANDVIESAGYFPIPAESLSLGQLNWIAANEMELTSGQWAAVNPSGIGGTVTIAGSSTVFPLTEAIKEAITESGFTGTVSNESVGSTAGFAAFCQGEVDIVAASRPIQSGEFETCRDNDRLPLEFPVGADKLVVVVNPANNFANNLTIDQLQQIFSGAASWSDIDSSWPNEAVVRYMPGADSGTLDFFLGEVYNISLDSLSKEDLVKILVANVSAGRGRALEREQRFFQSALVFETPERWNEACAAPARERPAGCTAEPRTQEEMVDLITSEVVQPDVVQVYSLFDSLVNRQAVQREVERLYPNGRLEFRSWLTTDFVSTPQSDVPERAGVRTAIYGSLWVVAITILFSFPVGVGAAIYLEEYATENRLNRIIQTNINNLAGVPSIIYGMLGLAIFVRTLEVITGGEAFGSGEGTSRTVLSAGLTLGLLILPLIIINGQEALRAVPNSMRQAGMALGATKWQTTWHHVLPSALPGIMTGTILALSRALGETAPLVVVGASTFITSDPTSPFSRFTTLPIQIYQWTSRPQAEFQNIAAAGIIVLLALLLALNATAVYLRNRYARRA